LSKERDKREGVLIVQWIMANGKRRMEKPELENLRA